MLYQFNLTRVRAITAVIALFITQLLSAQAPAIGWQKTYGGSAIEYANAIDNTTDGGYVFSGFTYSNDGDVILNHGITDGWIVKLDGSGTMLWQKSLGGSGIEGIIDISQTADGGYILGGHSSAADGDVTINNGETDLWIVKLDNLGDIVWQTSLGGSDHESAISVRQTAEGGYIATGDTRSSDGDVTMHQGNRDYWVVKLDAGGGLSWERAYGGSGDDVPYVIRQTADGGYVVTGWSASSDGDVTGNHGSADTWMLKLDSAGDIEWQKSYGGTGFDRSSGLQQTSDTGYIICGSSNSSDGDITGNHGSYDYWVAKLNNTGDITWQKSLGGSGSDSSSDVVITTDGGYLVSGLAFSTDGDVSGNHGLGDFWLVKLDASGVLVWEKALGGSGDELAFYLQQTPDNGYVVAGTTPSIDGDVTVNQGLNDVWIVKLLAEPLAATCPADLDGNGLVNTNDLLLFLALYGQTCN